MRSMLTTLCAMLLLATLPLAGCKANAASVAAPESHVAWVDPPEAPTTPDPDRFEPDDTTSTAKILVLDGPRQLRSISPTTDVDWIMIPAYRAGASFSIGGNGPLQYDIYDSKWHRIGSGASTSESSTETASGEGGWGSSGSMYPRTGPVFIRVRSLDHPARSSAYYVQYSSRSR